MTEFMIEDSLGFEAEESDGERHARILAEEDHELLYQFRKAREAKGWSQADLAAVLGNKVENVDEFEGGTPSPKLSTIRRYAHALGLVVEHSTYQYVNEATKNG